MSIQSTLFLFNKLKNAIIEIIYMIFIAVIICVLMCQSELICLFDGFCEWISGYYVHNFPESENSLKSEKSICITKIEKKVLRFVCSHFLFHQFHSIDFIQIFAIFVSIFMVESTHDSIRYYIINHAAYNKKSAHFVM